MNVLLFIHIVISFLLIVMILLQKTGADGLSGLRSGNNMGIVSGQTASNFMSKATAVLAALFMINSLVLANLSSRKNISAVSIINQQLENKEPSDEVEVAK